MAPNPTAPLTVIGLMSGTSLDNVDAACVRVQLSPSGEALTQFELLGSTTADIPETLKNRLFNLIQAPSVTLSEVCTLHFDVGRLMGETALALMQTLEKQGITVDLIASHGQTVWHTPPSSDQLGSTLQLGEGALIAEITGKPVVANFRPGDMAVGGQGAPLVPFADKRLFQHETDARAVHNIGGIANLTALPALSDPKTPLMAFDTGPGNMILDALCELGYGDSCDRDGRYSAQGTVHKPLLETLLADPYFSQAPPKSTGRERFGKPFTQALWDTWRDTLSADDLIRTALEFTAVTMANAYRDFVLPTIAVKTVIVGGGGVKNPMLMTRLQALLSSLSIDLKTHDDFGVSSQYKEAIAFALLGYARYCGIPGNIPSCTGANKAVLLGSMWEPYNT